MCFFQNLNVINEVQRQQYLIEQYNFFKNFNKWLSEKVVAMKEDAGDIHYKQLESGGFCIDAYAHEN
jgi:hypothetical protein